MTNVSDTLIILEPQGQERRWPIVGDEFVIGRNYGCAVVIGEGNALISGEHIGVTRQAGRYTLHVLGQNPLRFGSETLQRGEQRSWQGEEVALADYHLRLEQVNPPPATPSPAKPVTGSNREDEQVSIPGIVPKHVTIIPPGNSELSVAVIYRDKVIDHFELIPEGERINPIWFTASEVIREGRGGQGQLTLLIALRDEPANLADEYPFEVLVRSKNTGRILKRMDVHLTIAPYYRFTSHLSGVQDGQTTRVGETLYVAIANQGNSAQTYTVEGKFGKDKRVTFERLKIPCTLAPGEQKQIAIRPTWPHPAWWNRRWVNRAEQEHVAMITVQPERGEPQTHDLSVVSRGLIPTWVVRYGPLALLGLCLLLLYLLQPSVEAWAGACENRNNTFITNTPTITVCVAVNRADRLIFTWENGQKQEILDPKLSATYTLTGTFAGPPQITIQAVNWFGTYSLPLPFTAKSTAVAIWQTATPTVAPAPLAPTIKSFQVAPSRLIQGEENGTIRFDWEVSENAKRAIITDQEGNTPVSVQIPPHFKGDIPAPAKPSTYTLVVEGEGNTRSLPSTPVFVNVITPICKTAIDKLKLRPEPLVRDYHINLEELPQNTELLIQASSVTKEGGRWLYVSVKALGQSGWVAYSIGEQILVTCDNVSLDEINKLPATAVPNFPTPIPPTDTPIPVPPTATPTPSPTAPPVFFNVAEVIKPCDTTPGVVRISGRTQIPGYEVVYGDFATNKSIERSKGSDNVDGAYELKLDGGPITAGFVWVRNDKGEPISTPATLVGLTCYQVVVNFYMR